MISENIVLQVAGLKAGYNEKQVLHGLDLDILRSETFGVIGLNGAGKTTMIKTILGLKNQTAGEIKILGLDKMAPIVKADIAYLPERFEPPWFLKGGEFIRFSAGLYNRSVSSEQIVTYCEKLALDRAVINQRVQTYSKGMRQKLGLIATLLTGCSILILDEPMSGLDPLARALVKDTLLATKAEGRTIVLSSHILSDMDEICDRICVIHDGIIHYTGTPAGFREQMGEASLERAFLNVVRPRQNAA